LHRLWAKVGQNLRRVYPNRGSAKGQEVDFRSGIVSGGAPKAEKDALTTDALG